MKFAVGAGASFDDGIGVGVGATGGGTATVAELRGVATSGLFAAELEPTVDRRPAQRAARMPATRIRVATIPKRR